MPTESDTGSCAIYHRKMQEFSEKELQEKVEENKLSTIQTLARGAAGTRDCMVEVLINVKTGTCDYIELIPLFKKAAERTDDFTNLDRYGGGIPPVVDLYTNSYIKASALLAIENIEENAGLKSDNKFAAALKSNDTALIENVLNFLNAEGKCADRTLIPILEKIVRKDFYYSYDFSHGIRKIGELRIPARDLIWKIARNMGFTLEELGLENLGTAADKYDREKNAGKCFCDTLGDDLTVNTGRDAVFPGAFRKLISVTETQYVNEIGHEASLLRCPDCGSYFQWTDIPQFYGSGNLDEERLVRLKSEVSHLLDRLYSSAPNEHPKPGDVEEYFKIVPFYLLLMAFKSLPLKNSEIITPFVPELVRLLIEENKHSAWYLLTAYFSNKPERAEAVVEAFRRLVQREVNDSDKIIN